MSYVAIARKWRPQHFKDLVGQEHVVQTLQNAIAHDRVAHAYLFSGPRGIGKTSVARIFARALRCPNDEQPESDQIAEGKSLDVVEIDGASNNGVEAVRGIRENVAYGASNGKYKIYIIDEVHMLSLSAFNALLKTLEEPPSHVIFMFATTEAHKIPMTILSRCQRFEFRRLTTPQITERLKQILSEEGFLISDEGLRLIARHSDGALRDALSLLDQVLSHYSGQQASTQALEESDVVQALGISDSASVSNFVKHIVNKDTDALLKLIEDVFFAGIDLKHFCERSLEDVRKLYLLSINPNASADSLDLPQAQFNELKNLSQKSSSLEIERMSQILSKSISQLSWASLPRLVVEMAAIKMARLDGLSKLEQNLLATPVQAPAASLSAAPVEKALSKPKAPTTSAPPVKITPTPQAPRPQPPKPVAAGTDNWKQLVDTIMKKRPLLGALLSHANFKLENKNNRKKVILAFEPDSFYEKQVKETKNRDDILKLVGEYFGNGTDVEISNIMKDTHSSLETRRNEERAELKKKALEHPSVLQAKETLGAEIVDVTIDN